VELQHRGAALIYEETKGMTIAEELAYWQRCTAELRQQQQARWQAQKLTATSKPA
jgi:hypothetical protein